MNKHLRGSLSALVDVLEMFRAIDPDIQANAITVFLIVAAHGDKAGIPMADIQKKTGLSQAAVSRNVALLTDWTRLRTPGPGLVHRTEDVMNRRQKVVRLTEKGERFAERAFAMLTAVKL